jgi:cell division protein FtsB
MTPLSKITKFPRTEDGLRAVVGRAPQAEAFVASGVERLRPLAISLYNLRRRIATIAVIGLTALLFVHVMFGANGMVVYRQKRAEVLALKKQTALMQQENDRYTQQIQALKSDPKMIEKEARQEFGYVKPGEHVYVDSAPVKPSAPATHSAKR